MTETFIATSYALEEGNAVSLMFVKEDPKTGDELRWFSISGGYTPGFYLEYGDQGNANHEDAVISIELTRELFRVVFKPETNLVSWDYMISYTPGRLWDPARDGDVVLTALAVKFGFALPPEEWAQVRRAVVRIAEITPTCEYLIRN